MTFPAATPALPDRRATRRAFQRATDFDSACVVHDEARRRLLQRLELLRLAPEIAIDLGCATGRGAVELAARYPDARILAIDSSASMLGEARRRVRAIPQVEVLGGDAESLPVRGAVAGLIFANLVLPWCLPQLVFAEAARVLAPDGLLVFATLGPDTLREVRRAWAQVDRDIHVHAEFDMHDLGDLAMAAGLAEPVLDVDRLEVTYAEVASLVRDLRACGAVNVAAGRRRGLASEQRWRRFETALHPAGSGRFAVTVELVLGQAWGGGPSAPRAAGPQEIGIPVDRIGHRR